MVMTPNSRRGSVPLAAEGQEFAFALTTNAMVRYEDASGETIAECMAQLEQSLLDVRRLRRLIWAGLSHVDGMTEDRAGDIIDEIGLPGAADLVAAAVQAAMPAPEGGEGNAPNRRARRAAAKKT